MGTKFDLFSEQKRLVHITPACSSPPAISPHLQSFIFSNFYSAHFLFLLLSWNLAFSIQIQKNLYLIVPWFMLYFENLFNLFKSISQIDIFSKPGQPTQPNHISLGLQTSQPSAAYTQHQMYLSKLQMHFFRLVN